MAILPAAEARPSRTFPVLIIGAGGCGLSAAMAARDAGVAAAVLEQDQDPVGNTSWSIAMIPGAGSKVQQAAGITDSGEIYAADILGKTHGETDAVMARHLADQSGPAIDWLVDRHGFELSILGTVFPGHSRQRYHVPPVVSGPVLQGMFLKAARRAGAELITGSRVTDLYADPDRRVVAVGGEGPEGRFTYGCGALVLATDGFGANPALVRRFVPQMADAIYFGHMGTQGDSLTWGEGLGAQLDDMAAFQGHNIIMPERLHLTWTVVIEGGVQVNRDGRRFANEMKGYSEQATEMVRQPYGLVWCIYDERAEQPALQIETYREAVQAGALVRASTVDALAARTGLPPAALAETLAQVRRCAAGQDADPFGRDFTGRPAIRAPYVAARVVGSLFHTQGGLAVDLEARVRRSEGGVFPNLYAGGGAARGVSGPGASGYLGGNGLLCALVLGRLAGAAAARQVRAGA